MCSISGKAGPGSAGRVEPPVSHTVFTLSQPHYYPQLSAVITWTTVYHLHHTAPKLLQINYTSLDVTQHNKLFSVTTCDDYFPLTTLMFRWRLHSADSIHPWLWFCCHLCPRPIRGSFKSGLCRGTGWPPTDTLLYLTLCILNYWILVISQMWLFSQNQISFTKIQALLLQVTVTFLLI